MPRKDKYHNHVRLALQNDGWQITHDPYHLKIGKNDVFMDLGAEKLLAAERENEKIIVEIKSFPHPSFLADFYEAVGKFITYEDALKKKEPERKMFLAIPSHVYSEEMQNEELIEDVVQNRHVRFCVFDKDQPIILQWIK